MKALLVSLLFTALVLSAADVTGKWSGSFDVKTHDGGTKNIPAYMVLKQTGDKVTGTGGPSADRQDATLNGKLDGNALTLSAEHNLQIMNFQLQADGGSLKGEVTRNNDGGSKEMAVVSLKLIP